MKPMRPFNYCLAISVSAIIWGCGVATTKDRLSQVISIDDGEELALIYVPIRSSLSSVEAVQFHSLVWKVKVGSNWNEKVTITKEQFSAGSDRERRIAEIHSFKPGTGIAVIKVAEWGRPQTNGVSVRRSVVYSWREWNLLTNGEVRLLRICKDPFEPFSGKRIQLR